jgi:hypothetical protein
MYVKTWSLHASFSLRFTASHYSWRLMCTTLAHLENNWQEQCDNISMHPKWLHRPNYSTEWPSPNQLTPCQLPSLLALFTWWLRGPDQTPFPETMHQHMGYLQSTTFHWTQFLNRRHNNPPPAWCLTIHGEGDGPMDIGCILALLAITRDSGADACWTPSTLYFMYPTPPRSCEKSLPQWCATLVPPLSGIALFHLGGGLTPLSRHTQIFRGFPGSLWSSPPFCGRLFCTV